MYRCCNIKRFLRLLALDVVLIVAVSLFINTSGCFDTCSASNTSIELSVLMYHSICPDNTGEYIISPETFESDLMYLKQNGYISVLPSQLAEFVAGKIELPEKCVMLTFDDGCYNNLLYALPLLEEYNYSAVVSIVGEFTDINAESDPHCAVYSYLTWNDINDLIACGRIEIANHTYSMHSLDNRKGAAKKYFETEEAYAQQLFADISLLQTQMYENTGFVPICFTYPYGLISNESVPVLKKLGFLVTLGCEERTNIITQDDFQSLYSLARYNRPSEISTERFMQKIFQ